MAAHVEVELDIFSGMPNPTWVLMNEEADSFLKQIAAAPRTSPRELAGNLGYRGFIVKVDRGAGAESIHVQNGVIHISGGGPDVYAGDGKPALERWLLNTGRPHLKSELFQVAEREIR